MKITTEIRTMDEKAAFIAENMELTFDRVLDDFDIEWYYIIECKCYAVEDAINGERIFADYDDACSAYNHIVDEIEDQTDLVLGTEVTMSDVDVSHTGFIKSSELDVAVLSDLFDKLKTPFKTVAVAEVTSSGIVER